MVELQTEKLLRDPIREAAADPGTPIVHVGSHRLQEGGRRMDAGYYSTASARASLALENLGGEVRRLGDVVDDCFILSRFKRIYAGSSEWGWPYLSPSEAFHFRPTSSRWIARSYAPKRPEKHFSQEGWILVSASGTVGRPILVTHRLAKFFLSHDLVRVVPSDSVPRGYLYAYLSSWVGQALLTKDQYGAAIKHLEDHHVANVRVPLLTDAEMGAIADCIERAHLLREKANDVLDEATAELHFELGLPSFDGQQTEMTSFETFTARSTSLNGRFDASFHTPLATTAVETVRAGIYPPVYLADMCERIFLPGRFKRNYVIREYGVPFIQGSHIPLTKLYDLKYLARSDKRNLDRCRLSNQWVLISRSGTIGRLSVVSSIVEGSAASEHLIRIVPREQDYNPGYVAMFLMTSYGQLQVQSKTYGGVVDELTDADLGEVVLPDAPKVIQDSIGEKVLEAFENKDLANVIEDQAVRNLETRMGRG